GACGAEAPGARRKEAPRSSFLALLALFAAFLLFFYLDAISVLERPQHFERASQDFLTALESRSDFDVELTREPQLHRNEAGLAAFQGIDTRFRLDTSCRCLLSLGRVPHDDRCERNGHDLRLRTGDHVGRDRETGTDRVGGLNHFDADLE